MSFISIYMFSNREGIKRYWLHLPLVHYYYRLQAGGPNGDDIDIVEEELIITMADKQTRYKRLHK